MRLAVIVGVEVELKIMGEEMGGEEGGGGKAKRGGLELRWKATQTTIWRISPLPPRSSPLHV